MIGDPHVTQAHGRNVPVWYRESPDLDICSIRSLVRDKCLPSDCDQRDTALTICGAT